MKQITEVGILIKLTYLQARGTTTTNENLTATSARKWERSLQPLICKGVSDITASVTSVIGYRGVISGDLM